MKKKNPTLERTYEMIMSDRKLRMKVFKISGHFGGMVSRGMAWRLAKKIYEDGNSGRKET